MTLRGSRVWESPVSSQVRTDGAVRTVSMVRSIKSASFHRVLA
jgi:hypothetical protein